MPDDDLLARARAEAETRFRGDGIFQESGRHIFNSGVEWVLEQLPDREAAAHAILRWHGVFPDRIAVWRELGADQWYEALCSADAVLDLIRNGAKDDPEPQPSNGPDYHAEHAAWSRRNGGTK